MARIRQLLTSLRLTTIILIALGALLLLNVALPQIHTGQIAAVEELATRNAIYRFFLVTLGFGDMPTSPVFYTMLALFFINLLAVVEDRLETTLRRMRFAPPAAQLLREKSERDDARVVRWTRPLQPGWPATVLQRLGYRTVMPDDSSIWGVKNRTAIFGFVLFHLSFVILLAGAVWLFYTRFDASVVLSEGQSTRGTFSDVARQMRWSRPPAPAIALETVEPQLEQGQATQLLATVRIAGVAGDQPLTTRINHPITWGANALFVDKVGLAPVWWLQDRQGYTVDRAVTVVHQTAAGNPVVPLNEGKLGVEVTPIPVGEKFPLPDQRATTALDIVVRRVDEVLYRGPIAPGQTVAVGDQLLKLEEIRYWVSLRLVSERGGSLLVIGFVLGVLGLVWRMLWYRREVSMVWDAERAILWGRAEWFGDAFESELDAIAALLAAPPAAGAGHGDGSVQS